MPFPGPHRLLHTCGTHKFMKACIHMRENKGVNRWIATEEHHPMLTSSFHACVHTDTHMQTSEHTHAHVHIHVYKHISRDLKEKPNIIALSML